MIPEGSGGVASWWGVRGSSGADARRRGDAAGARDLRPARTRGRGQHSGRPRVPPRRVVLQGVWSGGGFAWAGRTAMPPPARRRWSCALPGHHDGATEASLSLAASLDAPDAIAPGGWVGGW